ncbi:hypothetical protein ACQEU6_34195 [Spirillospora sp. CA-108201]
MSGPRDAREHGEQADEAAPLKLPAFGLEAPWWAAESAEATPPAEQAPGMLSAPVVEDAVVEDPVVEGAEDEAGVSAPEAPLNPGAPGAFGAPTAFGAPPATEAGSAPPGTLVAGRGVPRVDSRGAVPAEPIVKPQISPDETDPEGFPPVPPAQGGPRDTAPRGGAAGAVTPETEATVDNPAVTDTHAAADTATDIPASLSAFEKAREAEDSASPEPVLVPDAILPPGVVPPTGSGPFPHGDPAAVGAAGAQQPPGGAPFHAEGAAPPTPRRPDAPRRACPPPAGARARGARC